MPILLIEPMQESDWRRNLTTFLQFFHKKGKLTELFRLPNK